MRRPAFRAFILLAFGLLIARASPPFILVLSAGTALALPLLPWPRVDKGLALALVAAGAALGVPSRMVDQVGQSVRAQEVSLRGIASSPPRLTERHMTTDLALLDLDDSRIGLTVRAFFPDTSLRLQQGDTLAVTGSLRPLLPPANPGETDWSSLLRQRGIIGRLWVRQVGELLRYAGERSARETARDHVATTLSGRARGEKGALAVAMLIGIRDLLDQDTMGSFRDAGIVHILSISGFHVGIVAALIYALGAVALPGHRYPALVALLGVSGYVLLVGSYAPVLRAGIMSATVLLALVLGRRAEGINSIGLAGIVLLIAQPRWMWDPGFQLSFGATLGILVFMPPMLRPIAGWPRPLRWCAGSVLTSLSAQLGVLPILLWWFRQWPTYSLLANVPAAFLSTVLIAAAMATSLAEILWTSLAAWCGRLTELTAGMLLSLADGVAALPLSVLSFGDYRLWLMTLAWGAVVGARVGRLWSRPLTPALAGAALVASTWLVWAMANPWTGMDRVTFLHVHHGNCVVAEEPGIIGILDPGAGRPATAARVACDHLRFRRFDGARLVGATSGRAARSAAVDTLLQMLAAAQTVVPTGSETSTDSGVAMSVWSDMPSLALGDRCTLTPLGAGGHSLDGLLIRWACGLRVLVAGDGGWRSDAQCATWAAVESTDVLYIGPSRDMAPSHLLLRRAKPRLVVVGGGTPGEEDLLRDLAHAGYRVAATSQGAVTVECDAGRISWRQHGRP
ncbi:MAG: ComEC family competence protein [Candidatus Eisenbacteria bacterium]|nr:ComEC family competence protein [Candidatus Eisenbacteria bacterium]